MKTSKDPFSSKLDPFPYLTFNALISLPSLLSCLPRPTHTAAFDGFQSQELGTVPVQATQESLSSHR